MTTPLTLPPGWRDWTVAEQTALLKTLRDKQAERVALARVVTKTQWDCPSDLAVEFFEGYNKAPHLALIDQAYQDMEAGTIDRVLICTPPQIGKSTCAAEAGPLWWLNRHPRARVTVASYAAGLASRRGKRVRNTIEEDTEGKLGLSLVRGSAAVDAWDLTTGGGMICMGVGGGLTGFGSDFMVVDDPHKNREEANSETFREGAWSWWQSTVLTRMAPGAPVCLIMTRWHQDDLAARVLALEGREDEGGRWRTIVLPAIAEDKGRDGKEIIDPMGRKAGEPLTHPKMPGADRETLTRFWVSKRREVGSREWPALFQQRPSAPEGTIWKHDWINGARISPGDLPELGKRVVAIDPSISANQNSDLAGIIICAKGVDQHGYVLADLSRVATPLDWGKTACRAALDFGCTEFVVEKTQGGDQNALTLKTAWRDIMEEDEAKALAEGRLFIPQLMPRVELVGAYIGKRLRAEPIAALYEAGEIHHVGDGLVDLEDEMTNWIGEGKSPDRLDAMVHGMARLMGVVSGAGRSHGVDGLTL